MFSHRVHLLKVNAQIILSQMTQMNRCGAAQRPKGLRNTQSLIALTYRWGIDWKKAKRMGK